MYQLAAATESMAVAGPARVDRPRWVVVGRPSPPDARLRRRDAGTPQSMAQQVGICLGTISLLGNAHVGGDLQSSLIRRTPGPFENTR